MHQNYFCTSREKNNKMKVHFILLFLALFSNGICRVTSQDAIPPVDVQQIGPSTSELDEKLKNTARQESDVPLSRRVQELESFQEETKKEMAALDAEQESAKAAHLEKLEELRAAEEVARSSEQENVDRLNAANQVMIDTLHEEQDAAEKKFKSQQAKIDALGAQNQELMLRLGTFFESVAAAETSNHSRNAKASSDTASVLKLSSTGGVSYVRWGRTVCDSDATVLYEGYGGSSFHSDLGGGSDILCLHSSPRLDTSIGSIAAASRATISGVEYGFVNVPFSYENNCGQTFVGSDMPCAVCHVQARTQQIMIPARDTCPSGWTREYWGFLVSSYYSQTKVAYTCLDHAPESIQGSFADVKSRYLYPIEAICGASLPCPPYVAGFGVPCVVCSK